MNQPNTESPGWTPGPPVALAFFEREGGRIFTQHHTFNCGHPSELGKATALFFLRSDISRHRSFPFFTLAPTPPPEIRDLGGAPSLLSET